jgi:hypothetical protein
MRGQWLRNNGGKFNLRESESSDRRREVLELVLDDGDTKERLDYIRSKPRVVRT